MHYSQLHKNTKTALKLVFATLLLAGGIVTLLQFAPSYTSDATDDTARILYAGFDGQDFEIFSVNPDGSDIRQLTNNEVDDWGATWSPSGNMIAFRSMRDGYAGIYTMSADGTHVRAVTSSAMNAGTPYYQATMTWSPNGQYLAFSADVDGNWDIYVASLCSNGLARMTDNPEADLHPAWSPNGRTIAFNSYRDGMLEIYTLDAYTGDIDKLTDGSELSALYPRWSPDGSQIAFFVNESIDEANLYIMDANGRNITPITTEVGVERVPTFSPDGESIVFRSERDGDSDIYTLNLTTGELTQITTDFHMNMAPDW